MALGNRGPLVVGDDGRIDPEILDAYERTGFYVFEGVLGAEELEDIERDVIAMLDNAPVTKGAALDRHGRPALGADGRDRNLGWVKPLSDPVGGTAAVNGRHPAKMIEPEAPAGAPDLVLQIVLGSLQFSPACLRVYGHPDLLRVAAAINGDNFVPFNEAVWIKQAGLGGSVAWHTLLRTLLSGYRGFSAFRLLEPTSQQVAAPSMHFTTPAWSAVAQTPLSPP